MNTTDAECITLLNDKDLKLENPVIEPALGKTHGIFIIPPKIHKNTSEPSAASHIDLQNHLFSIGCQFIHKPSIVFT